VPTLDLTIIGICTGFGMITPNVGVMFFVYTNAETSVKRLHDVLNITTLWDLNSMIMGDYENILLFFARGP
jgi:N-acetylglutamate synthase/N-acetylornithine aminotransferase